MSAMVHGALVMVAVLMSMGGTAAAQTGEKNARQARGQRTEDRGKRATAPLTSDLCPLTLLGHSPSAREVELAVNRVVREVIRDIVRESEQRDRQTVSQTERFSK